LVLRAIAASLLLALAASAHAQTQVDRRVAALKKTAAQAAAVRKWDAAYPPLREARSLLRRDRRRAQSAIPRPKVDSRYRKEIAAVDKRLGEKFKAGPQTQQARQAIQEEFKAAQAALAKKYRINDPAAVSRLQKRQSLVHARYDLAEAGLDELEGGYLERAGKKDVGRELREAAEARRLRAYDTLGKSAEADKAAARLLAMEPRNPGTFSAVAEHHQARGRFGAAAGVWQKLIRLAESGLLQVEQSQKPALLAVAHRQLAFCYSKIGKLAEARAATQKAQALEQTR
jgi:hypothetical protein